MSRRALLSLLWVAPPSPKMMNSQSSKPSHEDSPFLFLSPVPSPALLRSLCSHPGRMDMYFWGFKRKPVVLYTWYKFSQRPPVSLAVWDIFWTTSHEGWENCILKECKFWAPLKGTILSRWKGALYKAGVTAALPCELDLDRVGQSYPQVFYWGVCTWMVVCLIVCLWRDIYIYIYVCVFFCPLLSKQGASGRLCFDNPFSSRGWGPPTELSRLLCRCCPRSLKYCLWTLLCCTRLLCVEKLHFSPAKTLWFGVLLCTWLIVVIMNASVIHS